MRPVSVRSFAATTFSAALAAVVIAAAPARLFEDGFVITQRVITEASPNPITVRIKVAAGKIRLEPQGMDLDMGMGRRGGAPGGGEGAYMLLRPDGKLAMIMPGMSMAFAIDAAAIGAMGGGMMGGSSSASDVVVTVDDLGAGERILGYATRKFRMHQTCTVNSTSMRGSGSSKQDITMELSMAAGVPGWTDGLQKFYETIGSTFSGGGGCGAKQAADALQAKASKSFPLKAVATTVINGVTTVTTSEVTEITKASFDASEFELPPGVQVMDINQMMRGRGGH